LDSSLQCCEFDQEGGVFDNWERVAAHHRGESGELHLDLPQVSCPSLPGRAGLQYEPIFFASEFSRVGCQKPRLQ